MNLDKTPSYYLPLLVLFVSASLTGCEKHITGERTQSDYGYNPGKTPAKWNTAPKLSSFNSSKK